MRRTARHRSGLAAVPALTACVATLSACTADGGHRPAAGPTATSTAAPPQATALAERYRQAGGDADVYAIQWETGSGAAPLIVVRTGNPDAGDALFQKQAASVTAYLADREGLSLRGGYLMDVFGPDGRLLHRRDATSPS
ncbi:hypothetical protein ACGFYQ_21275 [Streptomyces sp. NPDC048258]|uniref:hypothetical protein n=1 Tax=Streptomyces sp. NPDC048258 TaxID=3365527 RepID=UPI003721E072